MWQRRDQQPPLASLALGWLGWLALVAVGLVGLGSCGGGHPVIVLNVDPATVPAGTSKLLLRSQLNGQSGAEVSFGPSDRRLAIYFPDAAQGPVQLELAALDGNDCKLAQLVLSETVPHGSLSYSERSIALMGLSPALCTVTVTIDAGNGSVKSSPAGLDCSGSGARCSADFPVGSSLQLMATGSSRSYAVWSGACAGLRASCALTLSRSQLLHVEFGDRSCSADGWCWENPLPSGRLPQAIAALDRTSLVTVGDAGGVLRCRGGLCTPLVTAAGLALSGVWAADAENIYAISTLAGPYATRCAASTGLCTPLNVAGATLISDVFGTDSNNVYLLTSTSAVLRCGAGSTTCTMLNTGTTQPLTNAWSADANNVFSPARAEPWCAAAPARPPARRSTPA